MFDGLQIFSNTIKQPQTRWPNGKTFGHQTMFDGVWSPNISHLDKPLVSNGNLTLLFLTHEWLQLKLTNQ